MHPNNFISLKKLEFLNISNLSLSKESSLRCLKNVPNIKILLVKDHDISGLNFKYFLKNHCKLFQKIEEIDFRLKGQSKCSAIPIDEIKMIQSQYQNLKRINGSAINTINDKVSDKKFVYSSLKNITLANKINNVLKSNQKQNQIFDKNIISRSKSKNHRKFIQKTPRKDSKSADKSISFKSIYDKVKPSIENICATLC